MASRLLCDGCGAVIREGSKDERERLRLLTVGTNGLFDCEPSWDFCSVGCIATWAVQHEMETHRG